MVAVAVAGSLGTAASAAALPATRADLREALEFRRELGLRDDRAYVLRTLARVRDSARFGTALTASEERELDRRLAISSALPPFERALRRRLRGAFAGLWIDQGRGGVVRIAVVGRRGPVAPLAGRLLPPGTQWRIVPARYSERELRTAHRRALRLLRARHGSRDPWYVFTAVPANRVVAVLPRGDRSTARLVGARFDGAVVPVGSRARARRSQSIPDLGGFPAVQDAYPPVRAGGHVGVMSEPLEDLLGPGPPANPVAPGPTNCTSGFMLQTPLPAREAFMLAFCGAKPAPDDADRVYTYNTHPLGPVAHGSTAANNSASLYSMPYAARSPLVWHSTAERDGYDPEDGGDVSRLREHDIAMTSMQDPASDHVGDLACQVGVREGLRCGTLMIRDLASSGGDCGAPVCTELRVSSVRLDVFDYGGPALADRKALGMVKSFLVTVSPEEFEELVAGDVTLERMLELMNRQVGTVYTMLANAASNYGLQPVLASDVADAADLAERFQPRLYFDSSERFRPLSVDAAFAEAVAGAPAHARCGRVPPACEPITSSSQLRQPLAANAERDQYLDLSGHDATSALGASPCAASGHDCTTPPNAAIYWHAQSGEGGYVFLDYWLFYRYNEFFGDLGWGNHESDWEAVTVALPPGETLAFDFVQYSQHGHYYRYLRDNLSCDGGERGSCGTDLVRSGHRVHVYPANGSHANYAQPCSAAPLVGFGCRRDTGEFSGTPSEKGHDGEREWESNDYGPGVLIPFPLMTGDWTFWAGKWGAERGPDSPGHQRHFNHPEEFDSQDVSGPAAAAGTSGAGPLRSATSGSAETSPRSPAGRRSSRQACSRRRSASPETSTSAWSTWVWSGVPRARLGWPSCLPDRCDEATR